jgi:hypothetical protein
MYRTSISQIFVNEHIRGNNSKEFKNSESTQRSIHKMNASCSRKSKLKLDVISNSEVSDVELNQGRLTKLPIAYEKALSDVYMSPKQEDVVYYPIRIDQQQRRHIEKTKMRQSKFIFQTTGSQYHLAAREDFDDIQRHFHVFIPPTDKPNQMNENSREVFKM